MHFSRVPIVSWTASALLILSGVAAPVAQGSTAALEQQFQHPPDSARPWVYWFWLNGNISSNGITADLEAMKRVGIGGVLIMEVDQGAPVGPVDFMSPQWRQLFRHVVSEAHRLGLEVNMNDDAGWNGSGGPWIKPEQSMQKVVWTESSVSGGQRFAGKLAQPQAVAGFYRDIAVLAFPTAGTFRIDNLKAKAGYEAAYVAPAIATNLPPAMCLDRSRILDLSARMNANGDLTWDAPAGEWTVMRFGHTSTGVENAPAPASGRGLECDKLSKEGSEANFAGMMGKLIADVGPLAGPTLVTTHIDSWENGAQNWTTRMREEFRQRRGYDLQVFLPTLSGRVVDTLAISERFLWDLRKTISELVVENYAGHMRTLAHKHGLRLSIEAYGGPCEDLPYAGRADEPMCEFWMGGGAFNTVKGMASAAHTYGKPILGAESFTAADQEKWLEHPGSIKALGDQAFCEGVSRFVFHRYAFQPWKEDRRPGMTMGPWGLHYERTQTWWDWSKPWHEYLARCQHLLRQGLFVADLCYLQPEAAPQDFQAHPLRGYDYDECSAEALLTRMSVQDGLLTLPDGLSYRILVLPEVRTMTPALLKKLCEMVQGGATVVGPRPLQSPSLADYPNCDLELNQLASELWGDCDGDKVKEHHLGKGRIVWGVSPEQVLAEAGVGPDFSSRSPFRYLHRRDRDVDVYFVSNPKPADFETTATFRVHDKVPELWWPETGKAEPASTWQQKQGTTTVGLRLNGAESVFVVFKPGAPARDAVRSVIRDGRPILPGTLQTARIVVHRAEYGVLNDPAHTRDVRAAVQQIVETGVDSFVVSRLVQGGDPAFGVIKSARIEYSVGDGPRIVVSGRDSETVHLPEEAAQIVIDKATYGVPGDAKRTRDVKAKLQRLVNAGEFSFQVARMAEGDDPAFLVIKTLVVNYSLNGKPLTAQGTDPENLSLVQSPTMVLPRIAAVHSSSDGTLQLEAWQPGHYEIQMTSGKSRAADIARLPQPVEVEGPWNMSFDSSPAGPRELTFPQLTDWSKHPEPDVRYFSGTAAYRRRLDIAPALLGSGQRLHLDLGKVAIMAQVRLNGKDLGILWKQPYLLDISEAARSGENTLEVRVVNLWVNRLIGDEQLPEDSERNPDGTLKRWPQWLVQGQPSPSGRSTFTSWRLWKKDSLLQPSGLLGPVVLRPVAVANLQ